MTPSPISRGPSISTPMSPGPITRGPGAISTRATTIARSRIAISLLAQSPKYASGHQLRAQVFLKLREFDKARKDFDSACELEPKTARHFTARAQFFIGRDQSKEALGDVEQAIKLEPKNAALLADRASIFEKLKQLDKAEADLNEYVKREPKGTEARDAPLLLSGAARQAEGRACGHQQGDRNGAEGLHASFGAGRRLSAHGGFREGTGRLQFRHRKIPEKRDALRRSLDDVCQAEEVR